MSTTWEVPVPSNSIKESSSFRFVRWLTSEDMNHNVFWKVLGGGHINLENGTDSMPYHL